MHQSRRRKKRSNYGIRTVEVLRGPNGFGFTISGQQPCILSCIVANSPADQAGLRAGDFLISVNGISVSKITHDAVVNLIGNCVGPIRMTIAENYYSDSSDEEFGVARIANTRKPKFMHKARPYRVGKENTRRVAHNITHETKNIVKSCLREPKGGGNLYKEEHRFQNEVLIVSNLVHVEGEAGPIEYKALIGYLGTIEMPKQLLPNSRLQTVCTCIRKLRQEKRAPTAVLMTILPTCLTLKNSSNNILAIYPTNRVIYIGSATDKESRYFGLVTSAVSDSRCTDKQFECHSEGEKKFNNAEADIEISNSCHVFVTDSKIVDHISHAKKAESFNITCTTDAVTGNCLEFPQNALYIVNLVQSMYKLQQPEVKAVFYRPDDNNLAPVVANSPQPSASSNSDSGIGFRDDCGNISDRILVVEFPARRVLPVVNNHNNNYNHALNNCPAGIDVLNIPLECVDLPLNNGQDQNLDFNSGHHKSIIDVPLPNNLSKNNCNDKSSNNNQLNNLNNIRACEAISIKNVLNKTGKQDYLVKQNNSEDSIYNSSNSNNNNSNTNGTNNNNNDMDTYGRLTCRAMPDHRNNSKIARGMSPSSITSSDDNTRHSNREPSQTFNEHLVEVSQPSPSKKSYENVLVHLFNEDLDLESSTDNISMHSSKSSDFTNLKNVFKTPNAKLFKHSKKTVKRQLKLTNSCDNLDNYVINMMNYKLSPKVYGLSKPHYSSEELNNMDSADKLGYGSLQDLSSLNMENQEKRIIAQSEPDVRIQRNGMSSNLRSEENRQGKCSEGPSVWATCFEKLLADPLGLHTFAEFLKKEFSAENIYFWTACERYRQLPPGPERRKEAQRIYQQHLCAGAPEAVNVDSHGRQCTKQSLQEANCTLFDQAQKQIFNLMKFDSYSRFLKSTLYRECLTGMNDKPELDVGLQIQPTNLTPPKLKKSLSNAEDRRRKSLLPWHRKNRSKSKDRGESEYRLNNNYTGGDDDVVNGYIKKNYGGSNIHGSRSSLKSLDLAVTTQDCLLGSRDELPSTIDRTALCRVILSNGSTTVVQIKESESIQQLVIRLLEKRGLPYSSFEVYTNKHPKTLDVNESSTKLAGCEVTVEQRVVFKLDLPNRKVISVKSKYTKIIVDILRPILHKYNYSLDQVNVTRPDGEPVYVTQPVTTINNLRLNIRLREDLPNCVSSNSNSQTITSINKPNKLDEITNQVFEGILQEKADCAQLKTKSDRGSVKSEDWGSEHSSGIFVRFLRRDSAIHERKKKSLIPTKCKIVSCNGSNEDVNTEHSQVKKPLIAKWKAGVNKFHVATCRASDELVEGLSRAQRSRLEDQRGTEINFELPDFLKDKESEQAIKKIARRSADMENTHFYIPEPAVYPKLEVAPAIASAKNMKLELQSHNNYENNFTPTHSTAPLENSVQDSSTQQNELSNLRIYSSNKFLISTAIKLNPIVSPKTCGSEDSGGDLCGSSKLCEPPPLPPKPKIVPIKPPNWGHNGFYKTKHVVLNDRNKNTIFLEQPSSSFV